MSPETSPDGPDEQHVTPDGLDRLTVEAVGRLTEALESVEQARGHLYSFHQMTGKADLEVENAADLLRRAGHDELAERLYAELVGRNVLYGRWTFQVVEDYDDNYWAAFRALEEQVRTTLTGGRRHLYEANLKEARRTHGHPDHLARPDEASAGEPAGER